MRFILLLCLIFSLPSSSDDHIVVTVGPQKADDASYDYFMQLLTKAMQITEKEYGPFQIKTVPHPGQERVLMLLSAGKFYDIAWSGSSKQRDEKLLRVAFPLFKGGLGWRGSIVRQEDSDRFSKITDKAELTEWIACQGMHWPDADILEQGGLTVYRVTHFDSMLQMLVLKRCDYLPLSIFEGEAELALVADSFPSLSFNHDVIIRYPLTMNFYVNLDNTLLAERLEAGLIALEQSGKLVSFMQAHPLTENAFPLSHFNNATLITLDNANYQGDELHKYGFKWLSKSDKNQSNN